MLSSIPSRNLFRELQKQRDDLHTCAYFFIAVIRELHESLAAIECVCFYVVGMGAGAHIVSQDYGTESPKAIRIGIPKIDQK